MRKLKVFFKNLSAGRKELFKRIGVFCGTALAVLQFADYLLQVKPVKELCEGVCIAGSYTLYNLLQEPLIYLGVAVVIAFFAQAGFSKYSRRFSDSDFRISIKMGDISSCSGCIVIPSNDTFVSETGLLAERSIHYQLATNGTGPKGSGQNGGEYLDQQVRRLLETDPKYARDYLIPDQTRTFDGKSYNVYQRGTAVPANIYLDGKKRDVLLFASSELTAPGAPATDNSDLLSYIDRMWDFIEKYHIRDDHLVVPIMGTGKARAGLKKQLVAKYILKTYAERASTLGIRNMTLSVYTDDYLKNEINLAELKEYANFICKFPDRDFGKK